MSCTHEAILAIDCQAGDKDAILEPKGLKGEPVLAGIPDVEEPVFNLPQQILDRLRKMNNQS